MGWELEQYSCAEPGSICGTSISVVCYMPEES